MPLDHYIPQVHLKKFYSPALGNLMFALRKSDLKKFPCNSKSVCRIENGSSNSYLRRDRSIEKFLKYVEPRYSSSLSKLYNRCIDQECVLAIAGFVASVLACSPTGMRIFSDPLKSYLTGINKILEDRGALPPSPEIFDGKPLSQLLEEGMVRFDIDPKFPQALGIRSILDWVSVFGNSQWEILYNKESGTPFFTSDFPIGFEKARDPRVLNRVVPLSPDLAVRICPDISLSGSKPDLSFRKFKAKYVDLRRADVININRTLVQCAEDLIFYRDDRKWVLPLVEKNRFHWIEGVTERIPASRGFLHISTHRIGKRSP